MSAVEIYDDQLEKLGLGAPEKVALARPLRRRSSVKLRWVSEHLGMRHYLALR
jgi:hypothetical protein